MVLQKICDNGAIFWCCRSMAPVSTLATQALANVGRSACILAALLEATLAVVQPSRSISSANGHRRLEKVKYSFSHATQYTEICNWMCETVSRPTQRFHSLLVVCIPSQIDPELCGVTSMSVLEFGTRMCVVQHLYLVPVNSFTVLLFRWALSHAIWSVCVFLSQFYQ